MFRTLKHSQINTSRQDTFEKVYSTRYIMLTYFILEKLDIKFLTFTPR